MALSMHTNYASLVTQNTLSSTNNLLNTAMERLSTGYRINSAADDAAGLQIASRLEAQTRGMGVAMRNSQDAISYMSTAEGALDEMSSIAYRMKDLATQAANGINTTEELTALDAEYQELATEGARILSETSYGAGVKMLDGTVGTISEAAGVTFQIGANNSAGDQLNVSIGTEVTALNTFFGLAGDLTTQANAQTAIGANETVLSTVGQARATLGANINRLEHTISNLANISENTAAAKGRIMDADFAVESSNMTKNQMLMQAGTTVLSQTNQLPGMAMSLLR
ncbi:lateral flagellin LafA [Vibrio sp. ZSDZ34]|uniref:Flagellin n=1 Tax=Vibrio gelatinilyticus TaxID=2893468 RepID=A0A9X1WI50_9VIBR|nr:lateral flagellin LafA [Vibrio gelatinilyticus]MCJ2378570.1 lateral flagellin LafA [Vibrio gelatinilyticus]